MAQPIRNTRAAGDARQARTGKDGGLYNDKGVLLASVDQFQSNVQYNNQAYTVLGDPQEHETSDTYKVSLTFNQLVVEDDAFITELMDSMETNQPPQWNFRGSLLGNNGTEQSVTYRDCLPSGQVDLQNIQVGQVVQRAWNMIVNRPPKLSSLLTI
ncbi:MAG: hypothetical protein J6N19_06515 [Clostridium sp.]|nr:hypothetical protein [Clostridium sp.]